MRLRVLVALVGLLTGTAAAALWQFGSFLDDEGSVVSSLGLGGNGTWGAVPAATLDCNADTYSGGATWACTGGTGTKAGTVTSSAISPFYPAGFGAASTKSAVFAGAGNFSMGSANPITGTDFTVCVTFKIDADITGYYDLVSRDSVTSQFNMRVDAGTPYLYVFKAGGSYTAQASGTVSLGAWNVACWSYQYVADGSSITRAAQNGITASSTTTAVGPPATADGNIYIGADYGVASPLTGAISRLTFFPNASSNAQLVTMTRSMMGAIGSGGEEITFTRASATTCEQNGIISTLGNNFPCINENGLQVFGEFTNSLLYSEQLDNAAWVKDTGSETVSADDALCPVAPDGAQTMDLVTEGAGLGVSQCFAGGGNAQPFVASMWLARATGDANCTISFQDGCGGTGTASPVSLTATPTRISYGDTSSAGGAYGVYLFRGGGTTCTRVCAWGANVTAGATLAPYIPTTNAAVTKNADVATIPNNGKIVDVAGAMCATVTLPAIWAVAPEAGIVSLRNSYGRPLYFPGSANVSIFDGTNAANASVAGGSVAGRTARFCSAWSAAAGKQVVWEQGVALANSTYDGAIDEGAGTAVNIGTRAAAADWLNGWIKTLSFCRGGGWDKNAAGACQ